MVRQSLVDVALLDENVPPNANILLDDDARLRDSALLEHEALRQERGMRGEGVLLTKTMP